MKTLIPFCLALALVGVISVSSCQKELTPTADEAVATLSTKDPKVLSAALKVWHGTRTIGTPPAPTSNTPAIDPTANPSVLAIAGRYAIIKPQVTSGSVKGYYVGLPGAGQYFKVDYSLQRDIIGRSGLPKKRNTIFSRTGNADSSIVIVLPSNINAPDTFCVTYCPYDSLGNIGQPVTTCIYVQSFGAGANNGWLQNDFRLTCDWSVDTPGIRSYVDTVVFNKWEALKGYVCDSQNGRLVPSVFGAMALVQDSGINIKNNIRFATNGAFDFTVELHDRVINDTLSTCSQFIFLPVTNYLETVAGGYSYNDQTRKLTLIYEFEDFSGPTVEYWVTDVIKINDNHFLLFDPGDNSYTRFER